MRVIAGIYKGRRLKSPFKTAKVRPTTDRAKETLFNVLNNIVDYPGTSFLDLFCGTGSIGIEFLSRGGKYVTFVDKDTRNTKENIELLNLTEGYEVIRNDSLKFLLKDTNFFDICFADPPYDFSGYGELINAARNKAGILIVEHSSDIDLKDGYLRKDFGDTSMTFYNFKKD